MAKILKIDEFVNEKLNIKPIQKNEIVDKARVLFNNTDKIVEQIIELYKNNKECLNTDIDSTGETLIDIDYDIPKRFGTYDSATFRIIPPNTKSNDTDEYYLDLGGYYGDDDVDLFCLDDFTIEEQNDILKALVNAIKDIQK